MSIDFVLVVPVIIDSYRLVSLCIQDWLEHLVHLGQIPLAINRRSVRRRQAGVQFRYTWCNILPTLWPVVAEGKILVRGIPIEPINTVRMYSTAGDARVYIELIAAPPPTIHAPGP